MSLYAKRYPKSTPKLELWKYCTLMKKKIKFSSYIRKFRMEQLQSHRWLTASSYMGKYLRISSYIRKPFLIYDFATAQPWISLYMRKILIYFLSVHTYCTTKRFREHVIISGGVSPLPRTSWPKLRMASTWRTLTSGSTTEVIVPKKRPWERGR
jgi:hypothetical protein